MRMLLRAGLALLAALAPAAVQAQDSQYWNQQYGPVAELLGGVVVGSSRDLSATFYNPGALALQKSPSLVASVDSFEAMRIRAEAEAPVIDFKNTSFRPSPSLFALALPRSLTGRHTLAISALTRQDFDLRLDNWQAPSRQSVGELLFDQSLTENWFGVSWAHPLGDTLGLGVTSYVAYRGQRTRREISGASAVGTTPGAVLLVDDFSYSNYRALWKAGLASQRESWDLGLTVTTPSVGLFGSGQASYVRSAVGGGLGGETGASVSGQHEEDLASSYKSPWSVAVGAARRSGANTFHAALEWFGAVGAYDVLDSAAFAGEAAAQPLVKRLRQQAKSVVNAGFGFERRVSERFSYYGAVTTDFTFADTEDSGDNALSTWNIYHATAGASLLVGAAKLTMGLAYAFGGDDRLLPIVELPPGGPPALGATPLDVGYSRLRVLVGFDFGR